MDEAEKIYYSLFKSPIPHLLKERFQRASNRLSSIYPQEKLAEHNLAINRVSDLEALELAARYTKNFPLLIMKFRLMIYLAETLSQCRDFYINKTDAKFKGWISLFLGGLRSIIKFLKGFFLLLKLKI